MDEYGMVVLPTAVNHPAQSQPVIELDLFLATVAQQGTSAVKALRGGA